MNPKVLSAYRGDLHYYMAKFRKSPPYELYKGANTFFHADEVVLDIGCGTGEDCPWLTEKGLLYEGVEAIDEFIARAREKYPSVNFIQDSLPELSKVEDKKYKNVLIKQVLQHFSRQEIEQSLMSIRRVMANHGRLIIDEVTYPNMQPWREFTDSLKLSRINISIEELILMLEKLGFVLKEHKEHIEKKSKKQQPFKLHYLCLELPDTSKGISLYDESPLLNTKLFSTSDDDQGEPAA